MSYFYKGNEDVDLKGAFILKKMKIQTRSRKKNFALQNKQQDVLLKP